MNPSIKLVGNKKIKIKRNFAKLAREHRTNLIKKEKEKKEKIYKERFELLNDYANDREHYIFNIDEFLKGTYPLSYYTIDEHIKRERKKREEKEKLINRSFVLEKIIIKHLEQNYYDKKNKFRYSDDFNNDNLYNFYYNEKFFLDEYDFMRVENEVREILKDEFQNDYFDPYL